MKIITEPTVRTLSRMIFERIPEYELPPHANDAENIIATAGKLCYDSFGKDGRAVDAHIRSLVGQNHESVLEHVHVGLLITGVSRGCSHEIVRHRMFNYSQRSTRYTAEDDAAIVLDPYYADIYERSIGDEPAWCATTKPERDLLETFLNSARAALREYRRTVDAMMQTSETEREMKCLPNNPRDYRKWVRGKARQLLPHALETRLVMTGNLRAWRHFLLMRTSRHAEAEIRRLAEAIFDVIRDAAPTVFEDLVEQEVDGFLELTKRV